MRWDGVWVRGLGSQSKRIMKKDIREDVVPRFILGAKEKYTVLNTLLSVWHQ